ncbi:MAG: AraC family transcriptional regulator [Parasporobacterium sp.]|nr:AraC family transcriptional regulator [Parasporobacterium sp.]
MYKLLIVDDEIHTLREIESHLFETDFGVTHIYKARSVTEALRIFEENRPNLILSDIEMSGQTGIDFLKILRKSGHDEPFIFLTCHSEFEYLQEALRLGSCDYLLKPINYAELTAAVKKLMMSQGIAAGGNLRDYYSDSDLVKKAKLYISDHLVEEIKISDVAEHLHWSESHIMKVFKRECGLSITEYITETRIEMACELLKGTDWNMSMVSSMCGFADSSYFTRVFRKVMNMSPSDFRREERKERL